MELGNPRHEQFAKLTATGHKRADAYVGAGYQTGTRKVATKRGVALFAKLEIKARVTEIEEELRKNSIAKAEVDREWVLRGLKTNIERASQTKPVLNRKGEPTGEFKYEPSAVNRGYELVGKELGMFADRLVLDNLDEELEGMTHTELRAFVRAAAADVGLRVVEMNDDEWRTAIRRHGPRLGFRFTEGGEDPEGTEPSEDRGLHAVPPAS